MPNDFVDTLGTRRVETADDRRDALPGNSHRRQITRREFVLTLVSEDARSSDSLEFHMSEHIFALEFTPCHDSRIHSLLVLEMHHLSQFSFPGSKHTSSKLYSLPRLFPIPHHHSESKTYESKSVHS